MKSLILTSLVVCLTFVSAFAGAKGEEKAVAAIKELGGKIEYGQGKFAQNVVKVDLSGTKVSNIDLRLLIQLKELQHLDLSETSVSDGTQYIGFIKKLQTLDLSRTNVDDAALQKIQSLKKLVTLQLAGTKITDEGLKSVAKMSSLKTVGVAQTAVSDAGLRYLGKLASLEVLSVVDSKVTEDGKKELQKMHPNLRFS